MTPAQNTQAYIQGFEDGERAAKVKMLREREWVDLTAEEMHECNMDDAFMIDRERAKLKVQAKLKERNQ